MRTGKGEEKNERREQLCDGTLPNGNTVYIWCVTIASAPSTDKEKETHPVLLKCYSCYFVAKRVK